MFPTAEPEFESEPQSLESIVLRIERILTARHEQRENEMRKTRPEDFRFEQKLKSGSFADRAAQLVLELREDIVLFESNLDEIASEFSQNFRSFFALIDYSFEIIQVAGIRHPLKPLRQTLKRAGNEFLAPVDDHALLQLNAEDKLLTFIEQFLLKLETALDSGVPNFKKVAIEPLAGIAMVCGFEKEAITLLVQKMSDEDVSGRISKLLRDVYEEKSEVRVIVSIFEEFQKESVSYAGDENERAERALRQCVIFMGFNIKKEDESLCLEAARIILNFLHTGVQLLIKLGQESELIEQCIITLTKLSKISDLRRVEGIERAIIKLTEITGKASFGFRVLIVNFLITILYSFQLQKTEIPGFELNGILDEVVGMISDLVVHPQFEHVNNKFYQLGNSIFRLHRLSLGGMYTNFGLLQAIWRKMLETALSMMQENVIEEVMQNYVESITANNQYCKQMLGQRERASLFNTSKMTETDLEIKEPLTRCEGDSPAFELLLLKRSINPACQLFANSMIENRVPTLVRKPEDSVQLYGVRAYKNVIYGNTKWEYGKGNELNQIRLIWMKRVLNNTIPRKAAALSDDQLALNAIRKQEQSEVETYGRKSGVEAAEEEFEMEETTFELESETAVEDSVALTVESPARDVITLSKKMKW